MAAGGQTNVLISTHCPLPENDCTGSLKSKHPCNGEGSKTGRAGRDRFLNFCEEENNDRVSQRKCKGALRPALQGLVVDRVAGKHCGCL